mgnify:CR=1 FL=1
MTAPTGQMDYAPIYGSNKLRTFPAAAAITQGQLVSVTGSNASGPSAGATVSPATAATGAAWVGVAVNSVPAGGLVTVYGVGTHWLTASGTIAAGANVAAASTVGSSTPGAVATLTTTTPVPFNTVVGVALAAATDGNPVPVSFR